jgi:hypothetical protein
MHDLIRLAQQMPDDALLASARSLVGRERRLTGVLIAHLAEVEARDLARREGHSSLFAYCQKVLGLSEYEAYARIEAARAARAYPLVLDLLLANAVTMTVVAVLRPVLTAANHDEVLRSACGMTKSQAEALVAQIAPRPDVVTTVRKVPARRPPQPAPALAPAMSPAAELPGPAAPGAPATALQAVPAVLQPLAPERFRYQLTIDGETRDLLEMARDLASHTDSGDAALLKEALALLVKRLARRRFAATDTPRNSKPATPDSRHVPASVKRSVYLRDGGRCAFVGAQGHRCNERRWTEFHHVKPYEAGGAATVENIQLRCRAHNQYEARRYFTRDRDASAGGTAPGPGC